MKMFTYKEYLKCREIFEPEQKYYNQSGMYVLREDAATYEYIDYNQINNEHDKIFRKILDNKNEAVQCIN